jgi:hypothetical protein
LSANIQNEQAIADHWAKGDVYALILSALRKSGRSPWYSRGVNGLSA